MNIVYLGGKQAGCIGLLTLLALKHKIQIVVPYDPLMAILGDSLSLPMFSRANILEDYIEDTDLIVSVHGREKVTNDALAASRLGGINVHPCLSKYRGEPTSPITRLLQAGDKTASVGVHWMTDKIDGGPLILEIPVYVTGKTENEIYNELYPYYATAIIQAMEKIK